MTILGVILMILGLWLDLWVIFSFGVIFFVVGGVLWILGSMGRAVGPRQHYY